MSASVMDEEAGFADCPEESIARETLPPCAWVAGVLAIASLVLIIIGLADIKYQALLYVGIALYVVYLVEAFCASKTAKYLTRKISCDTLKKSKTLPRRLTSQSKTGTGKKRSRVTRMATNKRPVKESTHTEPLGSMALGATWMRHSRQCRRWPCFTSCTMGQMKSPKKIFKKRHMILRTGSYCCVTCR
eukprot:TRINITY_DN15599_c0_g1_i5.p1 TRINITY_DN15599_c0_g1~~TRINITY_DN15599_c0_g1_i5.p1  ORF type:complete len:189 (-),score=19.53 TRINITY_DN15599_c0_g1_i5:182-748(-)